MLHSSVAEIRGNLDRLGVPYELEEVERLVTKAESRRAGAQDSGPTYKFNTQVPCHLQPGPACYWILSFPVAWCLRVQRTEFMCQIALCLSDLCPESASGAS